MRRILLLAPLLAGCVHDDMYEMPVGYAPPYAASACGAAYAPPPNSCASPTRSSGAYPVSYQTQEPPTR
jgi:hypothetical protein